MINIEIIIRNIMAHLFGLSNKIGLITRKLNYKKAIKLKG